MLTISVMLLIAALICTVASAMGKCPLWVAVLLLVVVGMLERIPR